MESTEQIQEEAGRPAEQTERKPWKPWLDDVCTLEVYPGISAVMMPVKVGVFQDTQTRCPNYWQASHAKLALTLSKVIEGRLADEDASADISAEERAELEARLEDARKRIGDGRFPVPGQELETLARFMAAHTRRLEGERAPDWGEMTEEERFECWNSVSIGVFNSLFGEYLTASSKYSPAVFKVAMQSVAAAPNQPSEGE